MWKESPWVVAVEIRSKQNHRVDIILRSNMQEKILRDDLFVSMEYTFE